MSSATELPEAVEYDGGTETGQRRPNPMVRGLSCLPLAY
jgi:hypothetical protein